MDKVIIVKVIDYSGTFKERTFKKITSALMFVSERSIIPGTKQIRIYFRKEDRRPPTGRHTHT